MFGIQIFFSSNVLKKVQINIYLKMRSSNVTSKQREEMEKEDNLYYKNAMI